MRSRTNNKLAGAALGLLTLIGCILTAWAAATTTPFSLRSVHVVWLSQDPPEVTPSGNLKIRGWQHLWYDDADDDRLDGYNTVEASGSVNKNGTVSIGGTFIVQEKLDDLTLEDFASGDFDPSEIIQGRILWAGTWHGAKAGGGTGVAHNSEGSTAFYTFWGTPDPNVLEGSGFILDPHGE